MTYEEEEELREGKTCLNVQALVECCGGLPQSRLLPGDRPHWGGHLQEQAWTIRALNVPGHHD